MNVRSIKPCWNGLAAACAGALLSGVAYADVTLYGVIDVGVNRVSNEGGSSVMKVSSGDVQQSRFGFRGTEVIDGGYTAFFTLENGFNADTGAQASTVLFSREARVGLTMPWGTVAFGRQAAPLVDVLFPSTAAMQVFGPGYYTTHPGDYDRTLNVPVDNSVKYTSPSLGGVTASVMWGMGEQGGSTSSQSTWSAGLSYAGGPLVLGAGFLQSHGANGAIARLAAAANPFGTTSATDVVNTYGLGASCKFDAVTVFGQVTEAKFKLADLKPRTYELGMKWTSISNWTLGADASTTKVHNADAKLNVVSLSAAYAFSKRTDVYVVNAYEKVSGVNSAGGALVAQLFTLGASSTSSQNVTRVALRHKF